jgi:diadenosine tetraphosphate (Ap4A) HIT family hydrolase/8-oxo-dGTP pyrophosphatase MutT (NUDIX family)
MPESLTPEEQKKQEYYRDARFLKYYDGIWQTTGKCVFCDLREKYVLFEQDGMVLAVTLYAYIDGDMMIIPRRHVTSASELTDKEWGATRKLMHISRKLVREVHDIRGVQFVQRHGGIQAQSTVEHLHIKCVPFDAPDLSVWNYRKLKHTPLENAALYKSQAKKIVKHDLKFEEKYASSSRLAVMCDAILVNEKDEVLLEERTPEMKFVPDIMTMPGGTVTNFDSTFEQELAREVEEETGLTLDPKGFKLQMSRINGIVRTRKEEHLNVRYGVPQQFVLNTYTYERPITAKEVQNMRPGDDCAQLVWVPRAEVARHTRISDEVKSAVFASEAKQSRV